MAQLQSTYLERLTRGKESASLVALLDCVAQSSRPLLCDWIRAARQRGHVVLLCLEESPEAWIRRLGEQSQSTVHYIDGFTACAVWDQPITRKNISQKNIHILESNDNLEEIIQVIGRVVDRLTKPIIVVIDGLNNLLCRHPLAKVLSAIVQIQQSTSNLVQSVQGNGNEESSLGHNESSMVVSLSRDFPFPPLFDSATSPLFQRHTTAFASNAFGSSTTAQHSLDLLSSYIAESFAYVATTVVQVHNRVQYLRNQKFIHDAHGNDWLTLVLPNDDEDDVSANSCTEAVCVVEARKKSGKMVKETVICQGDNTSMMYQLWVNEVIEQMLDALKSKSISDNKKPAKPLSFNLSLTDNQQKARAAVILPYLKAQQFEQDLVDGGGGDILYEADDSDDEDPDGDLDF